MHNTMGYTSLVLIIIGVWLHCDASLVREKDCTGQDMCSCRFTDDQSVIDLWSLGNNNSTPRFKDVVSPDGYRYSFNPCYAFNDHTCTDAAVCATDPAGSSLVIGNADDPMFAYEDGTVAVGYTDGRSGILTLAQINLVCDRNACEPKFEANGTLVQGQYLFTLTSVCACPNGCNESGPLIGCKAEKVGGAKEMMDRASEKVGVARDTLDAGKKDCVGQDQCSCQFTNDQSMIDITSLGYTDETPRFKDVKSTDGSLYSYNPCYPFREQSCDDAAVCMTDDTGDSGTIGAAESAKFAFSDGTLAVGYTAGSGILTLAQVILVCDKTACDPKLEADGSQGLGQYQFTLTSVCACPNGCDANGPLKGCKGGGGKGGGASGGLSGGSIILIVFFILLMFYMVGGVLFMKFKFRAEGREIIPNVNFWGSIPSLIKDGVLFTLRPCLRRR